MAAHSKVGRQSDQSHGYGTQGQDQEQPDHPHDVLGYQKGGTRGSGVVGQAVNVWVGHSCPQAFEVDFALHHLLPALSGTGLFLSVKINVKCVGQSLP